MEIAKALILAEHGHDDRGWSIASSGPRHLFPVANRPILFHSLEGVRAAGVLEATILAGPESIGAIRQAVGHGAAWELSVSYAEWDPSCGLRGALTVAREFLGDEPVLVAQADALLRERLHGHVSAFARERLDTLALRLPRPSRAATPGYLLSPFAVSLLAADAAPEPDPVLRVRAQGGRVRVDRVDACLACHGGLEALLESNRRVLEGLPAATSQRELNDCTIQGPVHVDPTAVIRGTLLRGPVIIGPGAHVTDSYIGPYTSIGGGVVVEGTEIEHSIVLAGAELRYIGTRLESSVIGRGARVARGFHVPGAIRMSIGDGAEVELR